MILVLFHKAPDGRLTWKITDFGFSSAARIPFPKPRSLGRMTTNYFAPELLISWRYDTKVDIWSAGCILYELATGQQAFRAADEVREYAWSGKDFVNIASVRPGLGREIECIVGMMLNVLPEMRPNAKKVLREISALTRL